MASDGIWFVIPIVSRLKRKEDFLTNQLQAAGIKVPIHACSSIEQVPAQFRHLLESVKNTAVISKNGAYKAVPFGSSIPELIDELKPRDRLYILLPRSDNVITKRFINNVYPAMAKEKYEIYIIDNVDLDDIQTDDRIPSAIKTKCSWLPMITTISQHSLDCYQGSPQTALLNEWLAAPYTFDRSVHPKKWGMTTTYTPKSDHDWWYVTMADIDSYRV